MQLEQHLEERRDGGGGIACGHAALDHGLEGHELVLEGGQGIGAGAVEHRREGHVGRDLVAQRDHVEEGADGGLGRGLGPARGNGADDQVVRAGLAAQQQRQRGLQHHEERGPLIARQPAQIGGQIGGDRQRQGVRGMGRLRGARPIGGDRQRRGRVGQRPGDTLKPLAQRAVLQRVALPGGVIGIGDLLHGQGRGGAIGGPERADLCQDDGQRDAVIDHVVQRDHEGMGLRAGAHQVGTEGRHGRIDRACAQGGDVAFLFLGALAAQIVQHPGQVGGRGEGLHRAALVHIDAQAQRLVAGIECGDDRAQAPGLQRSVEVEAHDFSDGAGGGEALDEPQSFLGV